MPLLTREQIDVGLVLKHFHRAFEPTEIVTIPAGTALHRFASSEDGRDRRMMSPWWWQPRDYAKIRELARRDQRNFGGVCRMQGAVKQAWSRMNLVICGTLQHPVHAIIGPGLPQAELDPQTGGTVVWHPDPSLMQTFLPDLCYPYLCDWHGAQVAAQSHLSDAVRAFFGFGVADPARVTYCMASIPSPTFKHAWGLHRGALTGKVVHVYAAAGVH